MGSHSQSYQRTVVSGVSTNSDERSVTFVLSVEVGEG
jgi:hypothetical protein